MTLLHPWLSFGFGPDRTTAASVTSKVSTSPVNRPWRVAAVEEKVLANSSLWLYGRGPKAIGAPVPLWKLLPASCVPVWELRARRGDAGIRRSCSEDRSMATASSSNVLSRHRQDMRTGSHLGSFLDGQRDASVFGLRQQILDRCVCARSPQAMVSLVRNCQTLRAKIWPGGVGRRVEKLWASEQIGIERFDLDGVENLGDSTRGAAASRCRSPVSTWSTGPLVHLVNRYAIVKRCAAVCRHMERRPRARDQALQEGRLFPIIRKITARKWARLQRRNVGGYVGGYVG